MAVVVPRPDVDGMLEATGVIAKEHIADAVASSIRIFPENRGGEVRWWRSRSQHHDGRVPTRMADPDSAKEVPHATER
ncbi:hypothetical protein CUJ89_31040 [Burkholderia pyrrocinia]|uniref:Uncharacterized protein n=1 Tax=Burkholderia pyrrocinia TaxID=60550 RepID=A0A2Z5N554_BURPY|nr:hypothetical protein [Burkholderia pyrrocinia]AXF24691.1 hypothetical protein CUJ89_31040 [Burkholderia pyrrocinia]